MALRDSSNCRVPTPCRSPCPIIVSQRPHRCRSKELSRAVSSGLDFFGSHGKWDSGLLGAHRLFFVSLAHTGKRTTYHRRHHRSAATCHPLNGQAAEAPKDEWRCRDSDSDGRSAEGFIFGDCRAFLESLHSGLVEVALKFYAGAPAKAAGTGDEIEVLIATLGRGSRV